MKTTGWKFSLLMTVCLAIGIVGCGGSGTPPAAPTNLAVELGENSGELIISWDAVAGASSYNIYFGTEAGVTKDVSTIKAVGTKIEAAASPYAHTGLTDGTTYFYIVTALDGSAESEASAEASGIPLLNPVGELDATFNTTGMYVSPQYDTSVVNGLSTDSSGKVFAGGRAKYPTAAETSATLWGLDANGALDVTFGTGGVAGGAHITGQNEDQALAMTADASGRLLLGGFTVLPATFEFDGVVWRFNADGSPDTTFGGGNGFVILPDIAEADAHEVVNGMTVDAEGRILLAGSSDADMFVCRLLTDGTIDAAFGGGCVHRKGSAGGNQDSANAVTTDPQGRVLVTGMGHDAGGVWDMLLWRFSADGNLDATFDGDGIAVYRGADADHELGYGVAVDASGRVIVGGSASQKAQGDDGDFAAWAYDDAGALDSAFGTNGVVLLNTGTTFEEVYGMMLDPRGRILLTGCENRVPGWTPTKAMVIVRFHSDGSVDTSFGAAGIVTSNSGDTVNDCGNAIATDFMGRIVVGGLTGLSSATVWRYR